MVRRLRAVGDLQRAADRLGYRRGLTIPFDIQLPLPFQHAQRDGFIPQTGCQKARARDRQPRDHDQGCGQPEPLLTRPSPWLAPAGAASDQPRERAPALRTAMSGWTKPARKSARKSADGDEPPARAEPAEPAEPAASAASWRGERCVVPVSGAPPPALLDEVRRLRQPIREIEFQVALSCVYRPVRSPGQRIRLACFRPGSAGRPESPARAWQKSWKRSPDRIRSA